MPDEQWIFHENFSVFAWSDWKSLKWLMTLLWRHFHQIQGNWAGRNFMIASRVNSCSLRIQCRDESEIYNYQRVPLFFYNEFINGVCLTCLTVTLISNEHPHLFHIGDPPPLYPQHSIPLVKGLYSLSLYKTPIPRPIDHIIHTNKKLKRLYSVIIYTNCHHKAIVLNYLL